MSFCYCPDCQKSSGGPFSCFVLVPHGSVEIVKGQTKSYSVTAESGRDVKREFCPGCGAPLFASTCNVFCITAGSLDDASDLQPSMAIWLDTAHPWAPIPEQAERFHQNPPISSGA
jgi:hypothetical protein